METFSLLQQYAIRAVHAARKSGQMNTKIAVKYNSVQWFKQPGLLIICFMVSSCPQPVLWVSTSRAQRDYAQAAQDSATPPPGERQCVHAALGTYELNPTLLTPRAQVSTPKTAFNLNANMEDPVSYSHSALLTSLVLCL